MTINFKCTVAILLLSMATALQAQTPLQFSIDHYAINVSDLETSVSYYQNVFGLKEIHDGTEKDFIRWFRLGETQELHIIEVENLNKKVPKGVHLALSVNDFDRFRENLSSREIRYYDWPGAENTISTRPDGIRQLYIKDPDGYWIEINDGQKH